MSMKAVKACFKWLGKVVLGRIYCCLRYFGCYRVYFSAVVGTVLFGVCLGRGGCVCPWAMGDGEVFGTVSVFLGVTDDECGTENR